MRHQNKNLGNSETTILVIKHFSDSRTFIGSDSSESFVFSGTIISLGFIANAIANGHDWLLPEIHQLKLPTTQLIIHEQSVL